MTNQPKSEIISQIDLGGNGVNSYKRIIVMLLAMAGILAVQRLHKIGWYGDKLITTAISEAAEESEDTEMATTDRQVVNGQTYMIKDSQARRDIDGLQNAIDIIDNSKKAISLVFEQGAISGDDGTFYPSTVQIRTSFIYIGKGNIVDVATTNGYNAHLRWYNTPDVASFVSSANSVHGKVTAPADYVAFVATSPSWGDILPSEGSNVSANVISALQTLYGTNRIAFLLSSATIEIDTINLTIKFPTDYCRIITTFGEKIDVHNLGTVNIQASCVLYFDRTSGAIVTGSYMDDVSAKDYYLIGTINGSHEVRLNAFSDVSINGVVTNGWATEFSRFSKYRYSPAYISILGDSISTYNGYSEGAYYPTGDVDSVYETWWAVVAKGLRIGSIENDVTVSAISQTAYIDQDNPSLPPAYDDDRIARLGSVHYPSYIFVNMGTNDPYLNNLGDMTYESDITALEALPDSTTKGIALTIRKLQDRYQNSRIVLLIPKPVKIDTVHATAPQYTAEMVDKIAKRIEELGNLHGVFKVIDLRKCDINQSNVASYCVDSSIHPNANGMWRMGAYILYKLLE